MKKVYSWFFSIVIFLVCSFYSTGIFGQVTVTTAIPSSLLYNSASADGAIVFGVKNTNASAIQVTEVANYVQAGLTATFTLWYHPTLVTGAPSAINTTNGWIIAGTGTVTNNPTAGLVTIFTGLNINIPANTTYRFAVSGPPFSPYYAPALSTPNFYSGGGLEIYIQDNANSPGYGGAFPGPPANTPRGFIGSVTFIPTVGCVNPPTPGTARSSAVRVCSGQSFLLDLVGNSIGTGQTYQWQSSPDNSTWSNLGASSATPSLTTTQTAATYYRAGVTCGGVTNYSASVFVAFGGLSGTYTINSALPTSGTNFQSFNDAVQNLSCISGPVVFNVVAGSGPYTEQVKIKAVSGASSTNTITFNGNGNTIQYDAVSGTRHVLQLDGADFIRIKKLTIASQNSTFGWGIHLLNGADNNIIDSCIIDVSAVLSTIADNSAGIVGSNSYTDLNANGNSDNLIISNNTVIGGYQGIIINGTATSLNAVNNLITGNTVQDFYANGIELTENDGTVVSFNNIHRTNRALVTTFEGIELGIGNKNLVINGNRIHDTHTSASTQTGAAYGIFSSGNDAPAGSENKITNNLIYNFNSGSGTQYGLYNSGSDGVLYYHNTVVLDNATSTSGITRGIYQTTAASNIEIKNNIVYITRGGTGTKHALYFGTITSTIVSNNNDLYVNATGSTVGVGSFGTTNFATLANWQTANGGIYDLLSVSADPLFAAPASGNFYPNNNSLATMGANVGVTNDILGNTRTVASPTAGAYEIISSACTTPPTPGTASASPTLPVCPGSNVILDVTGNSVGTGQTYQWQSASALAGPYTSFGSSQPSTSTIITPNVTTWYRLAVTCSGNTQYSTPVQVVVTQPLPAGTYTINSTQVTGGTNYQSFNDAVGAITCGIAGPVVFNVVPGTGPYNEQFSISQVPGASAVNTITFNGNNDTLQYNAVSAAKHIIQLNGADHIIIKKLNILSTNATYGWGVHMLNGADSNRIDSCTIDMNLVTSTTSDNSGGIVVANSTTDQNADGDANYNMISNNIIKGAYVGIIINGTPTALNAKANTITGNTIQDFYLNGIELTDNDSTIISFNNIHRANRVTVTTFEGIELGVGNKNVMINGNRIHDTHNSASSQIGTAYGIYITGDDAPAGSENKVINNLIYNFNSGTGTQYGIYNVGSDGVRYYHNTIVLDNAASTSGATRGFSQTTAATNIEFKNNIVYIARGGTGTKHALYFATTTSTIVSNNNVLFVNATGSTVGIGSFGTTNYATLANWQTANGGIYDLQSVSVDPTFASVATGNFYPNNNAIANAGAAVGVTTDILNALRSATAPTPGAYEIIASINADMGVKSLLLPLQQTCYSNAETVTVTIKNYSASTHNFVAQPVTVNVAVTGPNATTFTPVVVNTGSLASNDTLNVVISTSYNMTAAGTYTFTANTTVSGDANAGNDAMPSTVRTVTVLSAGTLSSNPGSYCMTTGIPTLTVTGNNGSTLQWQEATSLAGPWTNVGTGASTYTPAAAISATMYYRTIATCLSNADTSAVLTVSVNNPQLLTTVPGARCGPGTVNLSATGSAGATFNWYAAATGGVPLFTGTTFTTPIINTNTTYYVAATTGGSSNQNVGLPIEQNGTSGAGLANYGLVFDALVPFTLNSVVVYPVSSTAGAAGTVTIDVINGAGTVVHTATVNVIGNPAASAVGQTVNLNFNIQPGTNYKLRPGARSASITGLLFEPSASAPGGNYGYPFSIPGVVNILTSTLTAAPTNTPRNDLYYYFYNWTVSTGCESARQAVTATVSSTPAFDVTNNLTVCNNVIVPLQVNSTLSDFNNYTWSPANGLFTNAAATTPYTSGSSASTVYAQQSVPGTYTYIATANNTTTSCQNIDSVKVTVLPASLTVTPTPGELCVSGSTTLSISPDPTTFGAATFQWFSSTNNVTYTPITGATGTTYTTPTINATTFYKVEVKNSAGSVCLSAYDMVKVNAPQILTTTPAALCSPGVMTLNATATPGATINWYSAPVGGTLVNTGSSFTTPNLSSTTTYYVAALQGGAAATTGVTLAQLAATICGIPAATTTSAWALRFTTTKSVVINSAYVIPQAAGSISVQVRRFPYTGAVDDISPVMNFTFTSGQVNIPQQINMGTVISTAGNYQLVILTGGSSRITTMGCAYPMSTPSGGFSITGSATNSTATANTTTYNTFFEINVTEGCESPRVAVTAQVSSNTAIVTQPLSNVSSCAGASLTLSVNATGANLTYQWRKNTINIPGATSSTLVFNPVTVNDAGNYDVVINGLCGPSVTSTPSVVNVTAGNTWVGNVSSDWNTAANWCGGIPTPTSDVTIFPGTIYQPVISAATAADVRSLTISSGAIVTINGTGTLNIYGDFIKNGTFSAVNSNIFFKGTANQNIAEMSVGNVTLNNAAGVTLTGNMTVGQTLVLASGNLTLGINNLTVNGTVTGTAASHVVTNSTGSVISRNVGATAVTVPVGPSATSYNPVTLANGGGFDYSVRVATGLTPPVSNPGRAVNRTWNITPSGAATGVNITFQYDDTHMNTPGVATNPMEVGVHNGTSWSVVSPTAGVTPSGTPTSRQVGVTTSQFGAMVLGNIGAMSWITAVPSVDPTVSKMVLMPNLVESSTVLRVISTRASRITWNVVDQSGRVVMTFSRQVMVGQTDISLEMSRLAAGVYNLAGFTDKGKTEVLRFVKM